MRIPTQDDDLDNLINKARPATSEVSGLITSELATLSQRARVAAKRPHPSRHWKRPAFAGLATILVIGSAAAAAASSGDIWAPWAQQPEATLLLTLPSGAECEYRIGDLRSDDAEVLSAARNFYQKTDFEGLLTDAAIAEAIAENERSATAPLDNNPASAAENDKVLSPDRRYMRAVQNIVRQELTMEFERVGITSSDMSLTISAEGRCPGVIW